MQDVLSGMETWWTSKGDTSNLERRDSALGKVSTWTTSCCDSSCRRRIPTRDSRRNIEYSGMWCKESVKLQSKQLICQATLQYWAESWQISAYQILWREFGNFFKCDWNADTSISALCLQEQVFRRIVSQNGAVVDQCVPVLSGWES